MIPIPPNPTKWLKNRTLPLLISLIALIGLHPLFVQEGGYVSDLFPVLVICVPLFGLIALGSWQRSIPLVVLFIVMIAWSWFGYGFDQLGTARSPISYLGSVYYIYSIVMLAGEVLKNTALIDDRVYGGVTIYLLAAMMFSSIHRHISAVDPAAYLQSATGKPILLLWNDALYFSVSTITTVGYGDIYPNTPWARSACMLEAVIGVFITIVYIGRLAALTNHVASKH